MNILQDTPEIRKQRAEAYRKKEYLIPVPPVNTTKWNDEAWMNWVKFNNPSLTGFLPYSR